LGAEATWLPEEISSHGFQKVALCGKYLHLYRKGEKKLGKTAASTMAAAAAAVAAEQQHQQNVHCSRTTATAAELQHQQQ
jgi:hypothetical protein